MKGITRVKDTVPGSETMAGYVSRRIHDVFMEVAERVGSGEVQTPQDFELMTIFDAEQYMINLWQRYVDRIAAGREP